MYKLQIQFAEIGVTAPCPINFETAFSRLQILRGQTYVSLYNMVRLSRLLERYLFCHIV